MDITKINGLWVVKNAIENFTVLVAALDKMEAYEIAEGYFFESHMSTEQLSASEFNDINTRFDCDYILMVTG